MVISKTSFGGGGGRGANMVCQMDAKSPAVPWRSLTVLAGFFIGMHLSRECMNACMGGDEEERRLICKNPASTSAYS